MTAIQQDARDDAVRFIKFVTLIAAFVGGGMGTLYVQANGGDGLPTFIVSVLFVFAFAVVSSLLTTMFMVPRLHPD